MTDNRLPAIRALVLQIQRGRDGAEIDCRRLTAPCGLPCFACYLHLATMSSELQELLAAHFGLPPERVLCRGCRAEEGRCAHLSASCRVYPCARGKGVALCSDCADFPCDFLHPYADRSELWHNTKVFNLCLIRKMGLASWARQKAGQVLDTYSFEPWRL